jgi:hypothetical protein
MMSLDKTTPRQRPIDSSRDAITWHSIYTVLMCHVADRRLLTSALVRAWGVWMRWVESHRYHLMVVKVNSRHPNSMGSSFSSQSLSLSHAITVSYCPMWAASPFRLLHPHAPFRRLLVIFRKYCHLYATRFASHKIGKTNGCSAD